MGTRVGGTLVGLTLSFSAGGVGEVRIEEGIFPFHICQSAEDR